MLPSYSKLSQIFTETMSFGNICILFAILSLFIIFSSQDPKNFFQKIVTLFLNPNEDNWAIIILIVLPLYFFLLLWLIIFFLDSYTTSFPDGRTSIIPIFGFLFVVFQVLFKILIGRFSYSHPKDSSLRNSIRNIGYFIAKFIIIAYLYIQVGLQESYFEMCYREAIPDHKGFFNWYLPAPYLFFFLAVVMFLFFSKNKKSRHILDSIGLILLIMYSILIITTWSELAAFGGCGYPCDGSGCEFSTLLLKSQEKMI